MFNMTTSAAASIRLLKGINNWAYCRRSLSTSSKRNMRFVQFTTENQYGCRMPKQRLGAQLTSSDDVIYEISAVDPSMPNSLLGLLRGGSELVEKAKRLVANGDAVVPVSDVKFLPPITGQEKLVCVGLNYSGHCTEQNLETPKEPTFFNKFPSVIIGPNDNVVLPTISNSVDYEVELALVIGREAKNVSQSKAMDYIFGYTIAQDISARDWQKRRNGGQFLLGKSMDTFCPLGPAVVIKEAIQDVSNLKISCAINGVTKQCGNTGELVFGIDYLVSYLSQIVTLYPGDVILTGTPAGVGAHRNPPEFLKAGDVIYSEIESIGSMTNKCV